MERLIFIVLLLCVAQATLVQAFDCNTDAGKLGFLRNGSRTDPHCFNPVIDAIFSGVVPDASDLNFVCQQKCGGMAVDFLLSTTKCRENQINQEGVYFLQDEACAYMNGDDPSTSCLYVDEDQPVTVVVTSCFGWWFTGGNTCPALLPNATTTMNCSQALTFATKNYGCCYKNLYGTIKFNNDTTNEAIKQLKSMGVPVPAGFKINVTDQALFDACKIPLPEMCKSQLQWSNRLYP